MRCEKYYCRGMCFLGLFLCFHAWAIDIHSTRTFSHYQSFISHQETGVYEWNGLLFAVSKNPLGTAIQARKEARANATVEIVNLLYKWGLKQTADYRTGSQKLSPQLLFIKDFVEKYDPYWLCSDWSVRTRIREFPEKIEFGTYLLCQVFDIESLKTSFPGRLKREISKNDLLSALKELVQLRMKKEGNRRLFLIETGAYDGLGDLTESDLEIGAARAEYQTVQKKVKVFLTSSEIANQFKLNAKRNKGPRTLSRFKIVKNDVKEDVASRISVVTNRLASVSTTTNAVVRRQTEDEVLHMGIAEGYVVKDVCVDANIAKVVKVETKVITTTTAYELHDITHSVYGTPGFEEMFLSAGCTNIISETQTESGLNAVKVFYGKTLLDEKENCLKEALSENPYDKELWNLLGRCFQARNNHIAAIICFRLALRLDGEYVFAWTNLSRSYLGLGYALLAKGAAIIAYGLADDEWCIANSKKILLER